MSIYHRKIQLIAGTTYSVSLPKEWVKQTGLREKSTITFQELGDHSLQIFPHTLENRANEKKFSINADEYGDDVDQVLLSLFYMGYEEITIYSSKELSTPLKALIKKTLLCLSGTEIISEDNKQIDLKVLLDTEKIDIHQLFFRTSLLIHASLDLLRDNKDKNALDVNEHEIDRLYHLIVKIITLSSFRSEVLTSSKIHHAYNIMPYLLIAKRLEHLGDNLYRVSPHIKNTTSLSSIIDFLDLQTKRSIQYLNGPKTDVFHKLDQKSIKGIREKILKLDDSSVRMHFLDALRCVVNIEEELVNVSFFSQLTKSY